MGMIGIEDLHKKMTHRVIVTTEGCWQWTGGKTAAGYGVFYPDGEQWYTHRWVYANLVGPLIDGLAIDHLCRNRACVNPGHLEQVTHRTNLARGMSPTAIAARLDHCVNGHLFDEENTYRPDRGGRQCRICRSEAMRRFYSKRQEGAT